MIGLKPTISIIVPCLNEEANLRATIENINDSLGTSFSDHEIIVFNDHSTDSTGALADRLKSEDHHIRVVHNPGTMGFGYNYTEGVKIATKQYVMMVPGDNEIPSTAIKPVLALVGQADIVVPYTLNTRVRPLVRRVVSRAFVILFNTLFGLRLRYYNGTCVHKSSLIKEVPMKTSGFAYMAAILVRLIRSGASYTEVGINIQQRDAGRSKAFAPANVLSVVTAIAGLFWEVRVKERTRYSEPHRCVEAAAADNEPV